MSAFETEFMQNIWTTLAYNSDNGIIQLKRHAQLPNQYGVYIIRAPFGLNRVRGNSNVVYIGQSGERGGKQGIHDRIFNTRGVEELVREKIESLFPNQNFTLQVCLTGQQNGQLARALEKQLLSAYLNTHYELPPANHQCPTDFKFD